MATRAEVERVIGDRPEKDGVIVCDGTKPGMPVVGKREPSKGGGMTLTVIDPDPDLILGGPASPVVLGGLRG